MSIFQNYFNQLFIGEKIPSVRALRVERKRKKKGETQKKGTDRKPENLTEIQTADVTKLFIIRGVTWLLGIAFIISLLAIIIYPLLGLTSPQIVHEVFFSSLGYIGGTFAAFMHFDKVKSQT